MPDTGRGAEAVESGDVIDLITADHREMERMFAALRENREGRREGLRTLADLLAAHSLAEEVEVYPTFRHDLPDEDVDHGYKEHAESYEALAALQRIDDVHSQAWEDALKDLEDVVSHHVEEEESEVLGPARDQVGEHIRYDTGKDFMRAREGWLHQNPGAPDSIAKLVAEARGEQES